MPRHGKYPDEMRERGDSDAPSEAAALEESRRDEEREWQTRVGNADERRRIYAQLLSTTRELVNALKPFVQQRGWGTSEQEQRYRKQLDDAETLHSRFRDLAGVTAVVGVNLALLNLVERFDNLFTDMLFHFSLAGPDPDQHGQTWRNIDVFMRPELQELCRRDLGFDVGVSVEPAVINFVTGEGLHETDEHGGGPQPRG
jgi:hypothetical protein